MTDAAGSVGGTRPTRLRHLSLRAFRNFATLELDLGEGLTAVVGPNGHGKTNLIEAVYFLCLGRSFREHHETRLIRFGEPAARVEGAIEYGGREGTIRVVLQRTGGKSAEVDGGRLERLSQLIGVLPVVSLTPEDLAIAYGDPTSRRRLLDVLLAQTDRGYLDALRRYRRALAQRNRCLKEGRNVLAQTYEPELATCGAGIQQRRTELTAFLVDQTAVVYDRISGSRERLSLHYRTFGLTGDTSSEAGLQAALEENREGDQRRGFTSIGPHRDDLQLAVDDRPLRHYGSHGQARTALAALKLAEVAYYERAYDRPPILLMDEVTSVLDRDRALQLVELLADQTSQVLVTAPQIEELGALAGRIRQTVRIRAGGAAPG
jgi:DNA replication and repair protein RecF